MLKRGLLTYILLLCGIVGAAAQNNSKDMPKWTFGTEVSYAATFYSYEYHYFLSPEGYRDVIRASKAAYDTDSEIALHVGYNFNKNWNMSLYIGFTEAGHFHKIMPVSLRATRYFSESSPGDRWFSFIDVGSGISLKDKPQEIVCGKVGGGYRLSLSRYAKLDFIVALRSVYTHPDIPYADRNFRPARTYQNDGMVCSLSFGIGLTF